MRFLIRSFASWVVKSFLISFVVNYCVVRGTVITLDSSNIDSVIQQHEVVFVNFYADWCRFSQHLKPIFEEASKRFENAEPGKVAFASVDCDRNPAIGQQFTVSKYPSLKLFRNGELVKKEYRGQRSVDALADFVKNQLEFKVELVKSIDELQAKANNTKPGVIGYFISQDTDYYKNFYKVASKLRDDCNFYAAIGDWVTNTTTKINSIFFMDPKDHENEFQYSGSLDNYADLKRWLSDKCISLVREITFENAEELTEEGIPFLILFRKPGDIELEKLYKETVFKELSDMKSSINCLMADGKRFSHPLHHLGKNENDLPLIAIDSFRHMYLFPNFSDLNVPGKLHQFVQDLHSGKLHREFHHGPDPNQGSTQPPSSVFKQLKPSENRYSLLQKEEL